MRKLIIIFTLLFFEIAAVANGNVSKFSQHLVTPETFLPEPLNLPVASDKDYEAIKHVVINLRENTSGIITESMYRRIINVTNRSSFRYFEPNILHCLFSTLVGIAGAAATVCTAGAAAPIIIPAVIGAITSITSTGSYDLSKRELEKQENEYQDALAEIKQLYRNMAYYAANVLMRSVGNNKFWHIVEEEKNIVDEFVAQPIKIATKMTYQLRLSPEVVKEILSPLFYLQHVFYKMRESNDAIKENIEHVRDENNFLEQMGRLKIIFTLLDRMDEIVSTQAQDEGLKIALKTSLNSFRFKILEMHTGDLYSLVDKRTRSIKCVVQLFSEAIKNKNENKFDQNFMNTCFP